MNPAERIYRALLWLYPAKHRRAYGRLMVQHARDLGRVARQRGCWQVVALCSHLILDGLVNAGIERMEGIMAAKEKFKPVPWLSVLLATIPGLLIAFTRRHADLLAPVLPIFGIGYLLLLALAPPLLVWRRRQFPVWALLPAGALAWILTYTIGFQLLHQLRLELPAIFGLELVSTFLKWRVPAIIGSGIGVVLLNIVLGIVLFALLLRGRHVPAAVWALIIILILINVPVGLRSYLRSWDPLMIFRGSLNGPAEALMLVGVGLLAARQHGVLALLVVIGGYSYMFFDTDYLVGYPSRDWAGLPLYLVTISLFYLVLSPVALLRARTRLGQAIAIFVPALVFLLARFTIPTLAMGQPLTYQLGEILYSANILLSLILAWFLYRLMAEAPSKAGSGKLNASLSLS